MKNILKGSIAAVLAVVVSFMFGGCREADSEYVHTDNLISMLYMSTTLQGTQYAFTIDEYNAQGNLVPGTVTAEDVDGGYGIAHIEFPISQMDEVDLEHVFLAATVTYDVIITPGLAGAHDITGEGIVVNVKGGNGKVRKYRIYGKFQ